MPKKRFSAEQIVTLLRQIEVSMAQGKLTPMPCRDAGIWPAASCAALKGRTHGCTDQGCCNVKKVLANSEPSTHGT